jgi:phosphohistidine phosphatase
MKRFLFLRHAKSDWNTPGQADFDRPLAPRGERAARLIGNFMRDQGLHPDQVLCSSAARTRQTWELVSAQLEAEPKVLYLRDLYHASPHAVLEAIRDHAGDAAAVCVVGHHPGIDGAVLMLAGSGDRAALDRVSAKYPTGALAVLESGIDDWAAVAPGVAELSRFITPRELEK